MKNTAILILLVCCSLSFSSCAWLLAMTLGVNNSNPPMEEEYMEEEMIEYEIEEEVPPPPVEPPPSIDNRPPPNVRLQEVPSSNRETSLKLTATKMNVFYIGIDNPIAVNADDSPTNQLKVTCNGCKITGNNANYIVRVERPGACKITVTTGKGITETFDFRAKRIPDPVAVLGAGYNKRGGAIGVGEFKAQAGVAVTLQQFDFDAKCMTSGFMMTLLSKNEEVVTVTNRGAKYSDEAKAIVAKAKPGDTYIYDLIKCKCPGDAASRLLPPLVFNIK